MLVLGILKLYVEIPGSTYMLCYGSGCRRLAAAAHVILVNKGDHVIFRGLGKL